MLPTYVLLPGENSALRWPAALFAFQRAGVAALLGADRILLADDMGLGKTIQAITAMRILAYRGQIRKVLLVAPASVINQWRREIRAWAPELRVITVRGPATERAWQWRAEAHVTIVSFETLRSDAESPQGVPRRQTWDLVVLDEAQKIKNAEASVSHVCKLLNRRRSWAMTGTPLENRLEELASIMEFVDQDPGGPPVRYGPGSAMLERHSELQIRRRKADVLPDLPPKQVIDLTIPLHRAQKVAYDRAEQEGVIQLKAKGPLLQVRHVLELILRLKQLCNFSLSGESAKMEDIRRRLEVLVEEGHRALVFSQFTDTTFGVEAAARAISDFRPLVFTGSLSSGERDAVVRRFNELPEHKVLILSLRAGGAGLNLQAASYVFHLDRWWNPAVERQAEDRSHRMGQAAPVTVFKYTCEGTVEERIAQIIDRKQALFDSVIDDVSFDLSTRLTASELFGLFGIEAPRRDSARPAKADYPTNQGARLASFLEQSGWTVKLGEPNFEAERTDELGLRERLIAHCFAGPARVDVTDLAALRDLVVTDPATRLVVSAPSGLTAGARRLAEASGIAVWEDEEIISLKGV
jgi:SNF2 family DNA or RNA helicase